MPSFRQYDVPAETEVDVDIDIDVEQFLDECDEDEIKDVIDYLKEKNYLNRSDLIFNNWCRVKNWIFIKSVSNDAITSSVVKSV